MEKSTAVVLWSIKTKKYFKVNGSKIKKKEKVQKNFQTNVSFQETIRMESLMEKVFINGQMDKLIKANGDKDKDMVSATGKGSVETNTKVYGKMVSLMDQEHTSLRMEIFMKASLDNHIKTGLECKNL